MPNEMIASVIRFPAAPQASPGAFAQAWEACRAVGIVALPMHETEKRAAIRVPWRRLSAAMCREWAEGRFRHAGLVICTGRRGVVVADVDVHGNPDRVPELVELVEHCLGPSPLKARTASGGVHLYYRSQGERGRNPVGAARDRLPVDLKAEGGIVVAPPTITDRGAYAFIEGDWSDVPRLQKIRPGGLALLYGDEPIAAKPEAQPRTGKLRDGDGRNSTLFPLVAEAAWYAATEHDLIRDARRIEAELCQDPLGDELLRMVRHLWQKKERGELLPPRRTTAPYVRMLVAEIHRYAGAGDAFLTLAALRAAHGAEPGKVFAISARRMHEQSPIFSQMRRNRIEKAIPALVKGGSLRMLRAGRRGGAPGQYQLFDMLAVPLERTEGAGEMPRPGNNTPNHAPPFSPGEPASTARGGVSPPARRRAPPKPLGSVQSRPVASTGNPFDTRKAKSGGGQISAPEPERLEPDDVRQFQVERNLSGRALARLAELPPGSLFTWLAGHQPLSSENEARLRQVMAA
jgi:hypothetical protein